MLKTILQSALFIILFVSCKKEKVQETIPALPSSVKVQETISEECYLGIFKKDTISLQYTVNGNQITKGKLSYKSFEKDKNEGTIIGEIKGDTLFADYTFMSEGMVSVRQVAFLKKGDLLIEGFAEVKEDNGKVSFKNTKDLKFDRKPQLIKVDCTK